VENDAPPERFQISLRRSAVAAQGIGHF